MSNFTRDEDHDSSDYGLSYLVSSPVRLDQLDGEITAAHHWRNAAVLTADGDPVMATQTEPVRIYIGRTDANPETVDQVLTEHVPNDSWFAADVPLTIPVTDVQAKAGAGGWLSEDEVQVALRSLLAAQQTGGGTP